MEPKGSRHYSLRRWPKGQGVMPITQGQFYTYKGPCKSCNNIVPIHPCNYYNHPWQSTTPSTPSTSAPHVQ
eukprot:7363413-Karenia_brevis.AAC.1